MTVRKHRDNVKDGCGDSGTEGQRYTKEHAFNEVDFGYPGQRSKETSYAGRYTNNNSGLTRTDDFERGSASRDIHDSVEENQRPNGEFDSTGPIRSGISRSQSK